MKKTMEPTFSNITVQDLVKDPLKAGEEKTVWIADLLKCATGRDGALIWKKFRQRVSDASGKEFSMPNGIVIHQRRMLVCRTRVPAINVSDIPVFLSEVLFTSDAEQALRRPDLLEALLHHGMGSDEARTAISDALTMVSPDLVTMTQLNTLFGRTKIIRFRKITKNSVRFTVFSAIDLVEAALDCEYIVAQRVVYKLFKDYHTIDLDVEEADYDQPVALPGDRNLHPQRPLHSNGPQLHRVRFQTAQGTACRGTLSLALNLADALELLFLIPGSALSGQARRKAVDALIRVQGGDLALIDEILEKRALQDYLREHDPENPMLAAGEYVEGTAAARAAADESELAVAHRQRMNDLAVRRDEAAALVLFHREEDARLARTTEALVLFHRNEAAALALLRENEAKIGLLHATAAACTVTAVAAAAASAATTAAAAAAAAESLSREKATTRAVNAAALAARRESDAKVGGIHVTAAAESRAIGDNAVAAKHNAEAAKHNAEAARVNAEAARVNAEAARVKAEAEASKVEAEAAGIRSRTDNDAADSEQRRMIQLDDAVDFRKRRNSSSSRSPGTTSNGEEECRDILEMTFQKLFPKIRPNFLQYRVPVISPPSSGAPSPTASSASAAKALKNAERKFKTYLTKMRNATMEKVNFPFRKHGSRAGFVYLELDGFNEEMMLAFEFQGIQHFIRQHFYQRTEADFEETRARDAFKARLCMEYGVKLIVIPYNCADIQASIAREIVSLGIRV